MDRLVNESLGEDERTVTVSEASHKHEKDVLQLWLQLMEFHKRLDPSFFSDINQNLYAIDIKNHVDDRDKALFVATFEGYVVGYATAKIDKPYVYYNNRRFCTIEDVIVNKDFRNVGIGNALVERVERWAASQGTSDIEVSTVAKNFSAYKFFFGMGFEDSWKTLSLKIG